MAAFGLDVNLAISAVKDEEKGKKPKRKNKPTNPGNYNNVYKGKSKENPTERLEYYFNKPGVVKNLRNDSNRTGSSSGSSYLSDKSSKSSKSPKNIADRPFLLHEEFDDSEEDSSDDEDYDEDSYTRPVRSGKNSGKKRTGTGDTRYVAITGNIDPRQLSIAKYLNDHDMENLLSRKNYGIVISSNDKKYKKKKDKRKKGERDSDVVEVSVIKHPFNGSFSSRRNHAESIDDSIPSEELMLTSQKSTNTLNRRKNQNKWPPVSRNSRPNPPEERPPRGFRRTSRMPKRVGNVSSQVIRANEMAPPKPPFRKQVSVVSVGAGFISKGINKLAGFRGSTLSTQLPSNTTISTKIEERFLVATNVPWIIPPPPPPKSPPKRGSDKEQIMLDNELLMMFVEDLRSTLVKYTQKHDRKAAKLAQLQREIEKADDEIAGLVQPNGSAHNLSDVITSQLKSVTSGKIFRVEKY